MLGTISNTYMIINIIYILNMHFKNSLIRIYSILSLIIQGII